MKKRLLLVNDRLRVSRSLVVALLLATALGSQALATAVASPLTEVGGEQPPLFRFTTDGFWLNLHHFLYVLGRAEAEMPDAGRRAVAKAPEDQARVLESLSAEQRAIWRDAVSAYAKGPSQLDAVFDRQLTSATRSLAAAGATLADVELEPEWASALERAAPLYRQHLWPQHRASNRAWVEALEPLLEAHGQRVLDFLLRAYGETWPGDGYPVQISGYANWAGAYSTDGPLLVLSSLDEDLHGTLYGLEIVFHEAGHQWDESIQDALIAAAKAEGVRFAGGLSHSVLFFTAGEAVRNAVPDHVPYAEQYGLWRRRSDVFLPSIEAGWRPFLLGPDLGDDEARNQALSALMRHLGQSARR